MDDRKKLILDLLKEKDMYGFEIVENLERKSEAVFKESAGNLYPLLHELKKEKQLKSYHFEENGKRRKYYKIL